MRLLALTALTVLAAAASAQTPTPVVWQARVEPAEAAPGSEARLVLTARVDDGWRVYAMGSQVGRPLSVSADVPDGVTAGAPRQAEPRKGHDETFGLDYEYFSGRAQVTVPLAVAPDAPSGPVEIGAAVTYMVCDDTLCLPPATVPFDLALRVTAPFAAAPSAAPATTTVVPEGEAASVVSEREDRTEAEAAPPEAANEPATAPPPSPEPEAWVSAPPTGLAVPATPVHGGLGAFLLLAVGAGLAALLTPCVFPMVPLTVSYFTHHAADRRQAVRMAAAYGLAIVALFTGLGATMALLMGATGAAAIASNPWVNLFVGAVLVAFGFSMLGFFELRLPSRFVNAVDRRAEWRRGYVGVVFMGLTLALVSFSCTAPFVGGLLAATVQGSWARPIFGMAVFSGVFALPFVAFALFPNALGRLPRSGAWMHVLKGTLGFVEIAAALKFLSNADLVWGLGLLPRSLAVSISAVVFTMAGLYLLGRLPLGDAPIRGADATGRIGAFQLSGAVGFFALALYAVPGLFGQPLGALDAYLPPQAQAAASPPAMGPSAGEAEDALNWHQTPAAAFAEARATGRPVFVDFTGYTCTNCRFMEATVFPRPEIVERLAGRFVLLQLWTDDGERGTEWRAYQLELTGRVALPTYALVRPDGVLAGLLSGTASAEVFASFLDRGYETGVGIDV